MNQIEFQQLTGDQKLEEIYKSADATRKYLMWTFITTIIFLVLPLIILTFAIPRFLETLNASLLGL
jgi:hypothetical protein